MAINWPCQYCKPGIGIGYDRPEGLSSFGYEKDADLRPCIGQYGKIRVRLNNGMRISPAGAVFFRECKKQKSRIEMQLLLRIFRFCNPQRKLRKPSTNVYLAGVPGINVV
jgi:hypothetical protein